MTDRIVDRNGTVWVTSRRGARELGPDVTPALIRDWTRRQLITRKIAHGRAWYRLADLRRAEAATCGQTRPRACVVDDETPGRSQSHATRQRQKTAQGP